MLPKTFEDQVLERSASPRLQRAWDINICCCTFSRVHHFMNCSTSSTTSPGVDYRDQQRKEKQCVSNGSKSLKHQRRIIAYNTQVMARSCQLRIWSSTLFIGGFPRQSPPRRPQRGARRRARPRVVRSRATSSSRSRHWRRRNSRALG